ncbi:MAG: hypothetical protein J3T61_12630 [Candidatus Brocadiales bacterium]|nr:hypothetical protein [Candidatus Bathyanammoxibius sp.]
MEIEVQNGPWAASAGVHLKAVGDEAASFHAHRHQNSYTASCDLAGS